MRLRLAVLPPALLAAATIGAGACGARQANQADRFSGPKRDVARTIDDLRDAASRRDARRICDTLLTPALKNRLGALARQSRRGVDCSDQLRISLRDVDSLDLKVLSIDLAGNRATARVQTAVTSGRDPVDTLSLVDDRGWRIARLP